MKFVITVVGLLVLLAMAAPSAAVVTYYLQPVDSSLPSCGSTQVELRINGHGGSDYYAGGQIGLIYDPSCANVTNVVFDSVSTGGWLYPDPYSSWNAPGWSACWDRDGVGMDQDWITWQDMVFQHSDDRLICTITINCSDPSGNCDYCTTRLNFTCGEDCSYCPIQVADENGDIVPWNLSENGTLECGTLETLDFSKPLYEGWNLISLPLDPEDNSASAVLLTVSYDAVYRYDATSKEFESIESVDAMNPGTGYFVHVTAGCTWEYSGYAYDSMDVSLKQGLNMVGWLNCTKDVDELSSISEYYYVARWNAIAEKFEVYNPAAPAAFNDFTAMDLGTGYFISANQDCTLSETC